MSDIAGTSNGKRQRQVEEGQTHCGQPAPIEVKAPLAQVIHVVVASENATKVSDMRAALLCSVGSLLLLQKNAVRDAFAAVFGGEV